MDSDIFEHVKAHLIEHQRVKAGKLTPHTRLLEDLGIDGDDADEFLTAFSAKFNVDMANFVFEKHFGYEGFDPFTFVYRSLFAREKLRTTSVTIGDLVEVARRKKWPTNLNHF